MVGSHSSKNKRPCEQGWPKTSQSLQQREKRFTLPGAVPASLLLPLPGLEEEEGNGAGCLGEDGGGSASEML